MKKLTRISQWVLAGGVSVMLYPMAVSAQDWLPTIGYQGSLSDLIRTILNTAIIAAAVVAVGFLIFNGFRYMTSSGDTAKTDERDQNTNEHQHWGYLHRTYYPHGQLHKHLNYLYCPNVLCLPITQGIKQI